MAKIGIDPGHGGRDGGAFGVLSKEAANMLKVALLMKAKLEKYGHTVVLTRASDVYVELWQRGRIANNNRVDVFVSLHQNSAKSSAATGFETFIFPNSSNPKTHALQKHVHNAIVGVVPFVDRGKKQANFQVLRDTAMPAVLVEYGFINNRKEEQWMLSNLEKLADATVKGINDYFGIKTTVSNSKPSTPTQKPTQPSKPQLTPIEEVKEEIRLLQLKTREPLLNNTQKKDMKKLLAYAYSNGLFSVDHTSKVDTMTQKEAMDLVISFIARKYTN